MEVSKAVILAAGKGEKFYPFSYFRPKPMFPVCNKPILEHILDKLVSTGIKEICIVVGYRKGRIKNYFGSGKRHNCNITYVEQKEPLGTADALLKAENFTRDEPFVLVYGDLVFGEKVIPSILKAFTGKELSKEELTHIGQVILSDDVLVRRLVVLGWDTLEIHGDEGKYGLRWQLKDYILLPKNI